MTTRLPDPQLKLNRVSYITTYSVGGRTQRVDNPSIRLGLFTLAGSVRTAELTEREALLLIEQLSEAVRLSLASRGTAK